jgi:hypothetical protein
MTMIGSINGLPGVGSTVTSTARIVLASVIGALYLPLGRILDGSKSRDPLNTGDTDTLRAGVLLGKITSGGKYGPSILGVLGAAYDVSAAPTEMTVSAATATEIVRRIGASGTFKLVGPPSAGGTVQSATVTYSAVDTSTGVITVTSVGAGADEVQTIAIAGSLSAGTFTLTFVDSDGVLNTTSPIAHNASTANVQTGVDNALGASKVTVGGTAITGMTFTFGGVGYAKTPQALIDVDTSGLTGMTSVSVTRTTSGVGLAANDYIAGSLVQPTDGSGDMLTFIPDGTGLKVTDASGANIDVALPRLPIGGIVDPANFVNWPSDTSLKAWIRSKLNANGRFVFTDTF